MMRVATTAARKVVSFSALIGPFEFERAQTTRPSTGEKGTFCRESSVPQGSQGRQTTETYSPQTFSVSAAVVAPALAICLNSLLLSLATTCPRA